MKYKVFWIDDAHEKQEAFKEQASEMGVELKPHRSLEALKSLFENYKYYDSVLLDVRFIETDDSQEAPNSKWATKARDQILSFKKKKFQFVFYSGETDIFSNEEGFKNFVSTDIFKKGIDNKACINKLIELSKNQESFEIKQNYRDAIEACVDIGGGSEELLISLIKQIKNNLEINITSIRKLMENIFDSYKEKGLAPRELNDSGVSRFICGLDSYCKNQKFNYKIKENQKLPGLMSNIETEVWMLANGGSHNVDPKDQRNNPEKLLSNKYSRTGMVLFLCEFLVYVKKFLDQNPEKGQWVTTLIEKSR